MLKAIDISMEKAIFIIIALILVLGLINSIPYHPILRMIQFKFYKIESECGVVYTLISKREIKNPKEIKYVKKISNSMLMEVMK